MGGVLSVLYDILTLKICCPSSCRSKCCEVEIDNENKPDRDTDTTINYGTFHYSRHKKHVKEIENI